VPRVVEVGKEWQTTMKRTKNLGTFKFSGRQMGFPAPAMKMPQRPNLPYSAPGNKNQRHLGVNFRAGPRIKKGVTGFPYDTSPRIF